MNYYLLIPLLLSIILIIILTFILKRKKKELNETLNKVNYYKTIKRDELKSCFKEEWKNEEKNLEEKLRIKHDGLNKEWQEKFQKHQLELSNLSNEIKKYESILKEKEKRYNEVNQDLELYRKGKIEEIDGAGAEYEQRKRILVSQSVDKYRDILIEQANDMMGTLTTKIDFTNKELEKLQAELEVERSKRAAINEEIRRQRQIEENKDFYRIQLDPNDKDDIEILRSITPRLRHPEAINKIIWNGYYQKPLAELRKRAGIEGSGVYKITRLKTNEVYIGQARKISDRWMQHCKSALGVGTLASSQLHRVMAEDGPEQFLWEVLEEVEPERLRERESYYIDFYDSKNYGLNSVSGDKNK